MKAAVFHSPGVITCDTVEDPKIQDENDIILKVTSEICRKSLDDIITHRLSLNDVAKGCEIFDKKEDGCVKGF